MRIKQWSVVVVMLFIVSLGCAGEISAEPLRVTFLNPADSEYWFWKMETKFMQAAADDLGIELEVLYSDWNHLLTVRQAKEVVNRSVRPDYLLTGNEKRSAGHIIEAADKSGVDVFLFSNGFVEPADIAKYGAPRERYSHWIGQYIPNNFSAGYQIGKVLIERGLAQGLTEPDGTLSLVAFAGVNATHASRERVRGLEAIATEYGNKVTILQTIPGDWTADTAAQKTPGMFQRYASRRIGAIWAANDSMAFGVMQTAQTLGKQPGKDFLIGSCGWAGEAIEKVREGTLATTVGGHFMDGAWALVMLYDYHHGKDFANDPVTPAMYAIDRDNVERFLTAFGAQDWSKIDFTRFSKVYNPEITHYDFSLEAIFDQLQ